MAFVTVPEAAKILGTSRWAVRRLIEKGELKPTAITGKNDRIVLFDRAYIEAYAQSRQERARAIA